MPADVRMEVVTQEHWGDMIRLRRSFLNSKHAFCILPLGLDVESEVPNTYRKNPELMDCAAMAMVDGKAVGFVQVILEGMPCELHKVEPGEAYVFMLAVDKDARGMGVGSALLRWADELARSKQCDRISLEVIHGNPAIGLYERKGYVVQPASLCSKLCKMPFLCCIIGPVICVPGSPMYCSYGMTYFMVKKLE